MKKVILVTGGAGFIGSAVCRRLIAHGHRVVNVDKLTYSGNLASLRLIANHADYRFYHNDICDAGMMAQIMRGEKIDAIMHLAAESHVDRSIDGPEPFVMTNVVGTVRLLGAALDYWRELSSERAANFRFLHVSTDEVFGDLPFDNSLFNEKTAYAPSSPYSASKAASDHFARAWSQTYGIPVIVSNCSNNYGPYHFPEKLIPLVIINAIEGQELPVYGRGQNVRDWLYVDDHAAALELILTRGTPGETYAVGGREERSNLEVVRTVCDLIDERLPLIGRGSRRELIRHVADRPGHDQRYAIDPSKIELELGWRASESFSSGLENTVDWFLANEEWWRPIRDRQYAGERLGATR